MKVSTLKNQQIEGLRGVLVIMVVLHHFISRFTELYCDNIVGGILLDNAGKFGVSVFLVISSYYFISSKNIPVLEYYRMRFWRLFPAYYISITVIYLICSIAFVLPGRSVRLFDYLLNILFVNGYIRTPYVDGAHWYLTTLLAGIIVVGIIKSTGKEKTIFPYFIWLAIGLFLKIIYKLAGGSFVICVLYNLVGSNYVGIMVLGIVLRLLNERFASSRNIDLGKKEIVLFSLCILCAVIYSVLCAGLTRTGCAIIGLIVLQFCLLNKLSFLSNKVFVWFGNVSFSLYLIHQNIGFCIIYQLMEYKGKFEILFAIVAFICVLFLAIALRYCVEIPFANIISTHKKKGCKK